MITKRLSFLSLVAIGSIVLATQTSQGAEPLLSCSTRRTADTYAESSIIKGDLKLTCSDGRAGFMNGGAIGGVGVTAVTSTGQVREMKLTREQMIGLFGSWDEGAVVFDAGTLRSRSSTNMNLRPEAIRILGMDPNKTGNVILNIRSIDISPDTVLTTSSSGAGDIVVRPKDGAPKPQQCLYVGNMKVIKAKKMSFNCAVDGDLCSASVECLEPQVGWVTRSAVCKGENGKCPSNADACAAEKAGLEVGATTTANARQPGSRTNSEKGGGVKQ
jgi:hypothetical protein